jgi:hypothetical protein
VLLLDSIEDKRFGCSSDQPQRGKRQGIGDYNSHHFPSRFDSSQRTEEPQATGKQYVQRASCRT